MRALVQRDPTLWLSRSWTTRSRRDGEDAQAYRFVDRVEFMAHAEAGGFLEHAEFLGNLYGTPVPDPPAGTDVVLEIDVQGARQVVEHDPEALFIFLVPPSVDVQRSRLRGRGDDPVKAERRVDVAGEELEVARALDAHEIVNDDLDVAVLDVLALIEKERNAV